MNTIGSETPIHRLSYIPSELSHASSVHLNTQPCSSYIDTEICIPSPLENEESEEESTHVCHSIDELKWGYMKEEEIQSCISQHYGFVLKMVDPAGTACSVCHWLKGCTGCAIIPDDTPLNCLVISRKIAIDWDHEFLNNHYHQILYDNTITHSSVDSNKTTGKQSILLQECFQRFVQTELLQQEQRLRCEKVWFCCECNA